MSAPKMSIFDFIGLTVPLTLILRSLGHICNPWKIIFLSLVGIDPFFNYMIISKTPDALIDMDRKLSESTPGYIMLYIILVLFCPY